RTQHPIEIHAARLIDSQSQTLNIDRGCPSERGLRKVAPRVGKAMQHRCNLGLDQRGARGPRVHFGEMFHQRLEAVESGYVADKLHRQLLVFDDNLCDPVSQWVCKEPIPRSPARALQIDDGDFTVGGRRDSAIEFGSDDHFAAPKRDFRLSSPVLKSVETIVLTIISPWPFPRYCARHSTELPVPLGFTPRIPV